MLIFHTFITSHNPTFLFIYYLKFIFVVIHLFSQYYEKSSNESLSMKILLLFEINRVIFSTNLKNVSKINIFVSDSNYLVIATFDYMVSSILLARYWTDVLTSLSCMIILLGKWSELYVKFSINSGSFIVHTYFKSSNWFITVYYIISE